MELGLIMMCLTLSVLVVCVVILLNGFHRIRAEKSNEDALVIQSSIKGYLGAFINSVLSAGFLTFLLFLLASYFKYVYAAYLVNLTHRFSPTDLPVYHFVGCLFGICGIVLLVIFIGVAILEATGILIYGPLETYKFRKIGENRKVVDEEKYNFPMERNISERTFDKVTGFDIYQSTINRMMGTGTIVIRTTTYTNRDSFSSSIHIRGIDDLFVKKAEIEKFLNE